MKEHEKILVDGFDQNRFCKLKKRRVPSSNTPSLLSSNSSVENTLKPNTTLNTSQIYLSSTTTPSPKIADSTHDTNHFRTTDEAHVSHNVKAFVDPTVEVPNDSLAVRNTKILNSPLKIDLQFKHEEVLSDITQSAQVKTCEDLLKAGFLDNKVYNVEIPQAPQNTRTNNDIGINFRHRLCDQKTSGGGWTVNANANRVSMCSVFVTMLNYMLL